jgi:hypothetical protein
LRDPTRYWDKLAVLPLAKRVPAEALSLLRQAMPDKGLAFRVVHRQAGLGSLGRERCTAIGEWRGGKIAREAKALLASACAWAGGSSSTRIYYTPITQCAVRAADPFLGVRDRWVLRRLSPFCSRIDLDQLPTGRDEERLLRAMGRELANVHLGSRRAVTAVRRDLRDRKPKWLRQAAETMTEATMKDWKAWRKSSR